MRVGERHARSARLGDARGRPPPRQAGKRSRSQPRTSRASTATRWAGRPARECAHGRGPPGGRGSERPARHLRPTHGILPESHRWFRPGAGWASDDREVVGQRAPRPHPDQGQLGPTKSSTTSTPHVPVRVSKPVITSTASLPRQAAVRERGNRGPLLLAPVRHRDESPQRARHRTLGSRLDRIILFDALIMNEDRHTGNVAHDDSTGRVHIFDHSHAFLQPTGDIAARLTANRDLLAIGWHCLANEIRDLSGCEKWLSRIEQIPDYFLEGVVEDACSVGLPVDQGDACIAFLKDRKLRLRSTVKSSQSQFPKIKWA